MSNTLSITDILGAAMGMQGGQTHQSNPMGDILGSIMGGMAGSPAPSGDVQQQDQQTQQGGGLGVLGDVLGSVLGSGMGSMVGGGSSSSPMSSNPATSILNAMGGPNSSIIHTVSEKTGLPPMVIYMAVTFIIGKLMSDAQHPARQQAQQQQMPQQQSQTHAQQPQQSMPQQSPQAGVNLDDILSRMQSGKPVDSGYIQNSGMAHELGSQIGISPNKAGDVISQILGMMGNATNR